MEVIDYLRNALHETQVELSEAKAQLKALPWLIGSLRHIAKDPCLKANNEGARECLCHTCAARRGLQRFFERKSPVSV